MARRGGGLTRAAVTIEPGRAFGTGHHGSTEGCRALLEAQAAAWSDARNRPGRILDLGTGTGILAIAAIALGAPTARAVDVDPDAMTAAARNAALNGCGERIVLGLGGVECLDGEPAFDVVLANLLAHTHLALAADYRRLVGRGGVLILCENVRYARANRGPMRMLVKAVVSNDYFTIHDANIFRTIWGVIDEGDGIGQVVLEMNWAGENRLIDGRVLDPNSTCTRALAQISIHPDGRVGLCCLDPTVNYPFGYLKTQTLKEIYNSAGYVEFREWHRDEVAAKHPACATCTRI